MSDASCRFLILRVVILVALLMLSRTLVNSRMKNIRHVVVLLAGWQFAVAVGFAVARENGKWRPLKTAEVANLTFDTQNISVEQVALSILTAIKESHLNW